jgi:hypothetical protein
VEPGFAVEFPRRGWSQKLRGKGDGERERGYCGSIRLVQRVDAGGAVALDGAAIVGVHEGADEERGEKDENREQSYVPYAKRSPMRLATHQRSS